MTEQEDEIKLTGYALIQIAAGIGTIIMATKAINVFNGWVMKVFSPPAAAAIMIIQASWLGIITYYFAKLDKKTREKEKA